MTDVQALRDQWAGVEFARTTFEIEQQRVLDYAAACGDDDPRFTDPSHPDFEVHPLFVGCLGNTPGSGRPKDFPDLGKGRDIDGGKSVEVLAPIHVGDVLSGRAEIADVYAKTGRSGTMIFIVHRMRFFNQHDAPVAIVDMRQIKAVEG